MAPTSDPLKPKVQAVEEAVQLALASRWDQALALNDELLERFGADADTFNRKGKALVELGRLDEAEQAYQETLKLNPLNQIARRQTQKIAELRRAKTAVAAVSSAVDVNVFTEEPGKTAMTRLLPGAGAPLVTVTPGEVVNLEVGEGVVTARTTRGVSLGSLEPRLAQRLVRMIGGGNRYESAVAHVDDSGVQLIIRETYQAAELVGTVSFPARKGREPDYRPYAKESLVRRSGEPPAGLEGEDEAGATSAEGSGDLDEGFGDFDDPGEDKDAEEVDEDARPEDEY